MKSKFTIFVSSSDAYEDCWIPFFTLLDKYWPNCSLPIVLNTNTKEFSYPGLNISCPMVSARSGRKLAWGARLKKSLEFVQDDIILFMLDDYFIQSPVVVDKVEELVELMEKDDLTHIMLYPIPGPNHMSQFPMLVERGQRAEYRFSFQVGLWRKERLSYYLREHEDPWHAERWGTRRAWTVKDSFFCLDKSNFEKNGPIIDYLVTGGLVGGKWVGEEVVSLFEDNSIEVDFSGRSFYNKDEPSKFPYAIIDRVKGLPMGFTSLLDLYFSK